MPNSDDSWQSERNGKIFMIKNLDWITSPNVPRPCPKPDKRLKFQFLWYDLWIGAYVDTERKFVYICPLPCCVLRIWYGK